MDIMLNRITDYLQAQSWQIGVLVAVISLTSWALRHRSAHVRYLLWLIVLAKCLVPPVFNVSVPVLPEPTTQIVRPVVAPPQTDSPLSTSTVAPRPLSTTPPTPASTQPKLSTRQSLAIAWLVGTGLFALAAVVKTGRTIVWLRRKRKPIPNDLYVTFDHLLLSLGLKRLPRLWLIEGVGQPFVWGLVRGDIYLPDNFLKLTNDEHRQGILSHEVGHVLRFDAAVNILQVGAQAIFWFHPLVWWANKRIRAEREMCCDEMAIAHLGAQAKEYSTAIVNTLIQEQKSIRPIPSLAIAGPAKNIEERIKAMMRPGKEFYKQPNLATAATVILIMSLTVPTALVLTARAQVETPSEAGDESKEDLIEPLHEAIQAGDMDEVNRLIDQGADLDVAQGDKALTPLHLAASKGHAEIVTALLAKGANVNVVDADGNTALYLAILSKWQPSSQDEETVKALIEGGIDVNKGPQDSQPLNYAIWFSSKGVVETLLDAGAKTDVKDSAGWTPLHYAAFFNTDDNEMLEVFLDKTKQPDTIYLAAYRGDLEAVKTYISSGVDVNIKDSSGCTPLLWAVLQDSPAVVEYLIAQGAEIDEKFGRLTPLYCANALPVIELLISKGADINAQEMTRLHKACRMGDKDIAAFLLSKGADVNAKGSDDDTPLIDALSNGHPDLVPLLVANGADVNAADFLGRTPVSIAIERGYTEIVSLLRQHGAKETLLGAVAENDIEEVKRLIAGGADINVKSGSGTTPLHRAAGSGMETMVKLLIANGADSEARASSGLTPLDTARLREHATGEHTTIVNMLREHGAKGTLHGAACLGDVDEVKRLLDKGANINLKSDSGWTPLHWAAYEGHESVVELLLARGADIQVQNNVTATPLTFAGVRGHKDVVELLLAKGADINTGTPLAGAAARGRKAIVELLLDRGADVNLKNKQNGRTALDEAKEKNHTEIVELLRQHGATEQ